MSAPRTYAVDPADPRAPALEVWERLSTTERERVVAELPSKVEFGPPEGDGGDLFRFYAGSALLPESAELVERANCLVDDLHQRLSELETQLLAERVAREDSEAKRAQAEAEKVQAEAEKVQAEAKRAHAEQRLRELETELARLRDRS